MTGRPLVVGAGAAGLAVAALLSRRGIESDVLDRSDSVGASWAGRWDSLRLHTIRQLSGLPGAPIDRECGRWVGRDDLVRYLRDYADRAGVRPEFDTDVTRVDRVTGEWRVRTTRGPRSATVVVVATGFATEPRLPSWARPGPHLRHSRDYRGPEPYRGHRVLVVGGGNSGSEIAADLARAGVPVSISVRRPPRIVPRDLRGFPIQALGIATRRVPEPTRSGLQSLLQRLAVPDLRGWGIPAGSWSDPPQGRGVPVLDHGFVRDVRAGRIAVRAAVRSFDGRAATLVDGTVLAVEEVICATGFRPGLEPLVGHLGVLDPEGRPRVRGAVALTGLPGLYFVGISEQLSGQLREIGTEARAVAATIAATVATTVARSPGGPSA